MPLEIHLGERLVSNANARLRTVEEIEQFMRSDYFPLPGLPEAILRYTSNHDQESLMWVALWIVYGLVDWEQAKKVRPKVFANIRSPSKERQLLFKRAYFLVEGEFSEAFHPRLRPDYPQAFHLLRAELYTFCTLGEPKEENYHNLINNLSFVFDKLLATVTNKPGIVPLVVRSGSDNQANDEAERPRNNTSMRLRSHIRNSGAPRRRFSRQY